jgi:hypothetical protein
MLFLMLLFVIGAGLGLIVISSWYGAKINLLLQIFVGALGLALTFYMPMPLPERFAGAFVWSLPIAVSHLTPVKVGDRRDILVMAMAGLHLGTHSAIFSVIILGLTMLMLKNIQNLRVTLKGLNASDPSEEIYVPDLSLALPVAVVVFLDLQTRLHVFVIPEGPGIPHPQFWFTSLDQLVPIMGALVVGLIWRDILRKRAIEGGWDA